MPISGLETKQFFFLQMVKICNRGCKHLVRLCGACPRSFIPLVFSPMRDLLTDDSFREENPPVMVGS
jgi:hypothetical protein